MAEAVKNNSRKRRPPTHFYEGYNEDNFEPGNNPPTGTREQNRQGGDPFTISAMSRMLTKFVNSANKKYSEVRVKRLEQQNNNASKKQAPSEPKAVARTGKLIKQERQTVISSAREAEDARQTTNRQELSKQRYQQKNLKKNVNSSVGSSNPDFRKAKTPLPSPEAILKNVFPSHDLFNIESMAKISREQLFKMLPKGTDPNLFRQQVATSTEAQGLRNIERVTQGAGRQPGVRPNQFRQDTKLFKRASFHIGIAYNIHIENIKQKNPNFSNEELDPTYVSRKLKQQSSDLLKRQTQQRLRQQQQFEATLKKKQIVSDPGQQTQKQGKKENQIGSAKKEPICIDIEGQSEQKPPKLMKEQVQAQTPKQKSQISIQQQIKNPQKEPQKQKERKPQDQPAKQDQRP